MTYLFHTNVKLRRRHDEINFELTARCNINCPMCYVHMSQEQIDAAGKELAAEQCRQLPVKQKIKAWFLHFWLYDRRGKSKTIYRKSSNTHQYFPVWCCNETYKKMCGFPMYERVKENIRELRNAGISVSLNVSITLYNCQDLEQIYKDAVGQTPIQ